jgi:PAS domain-containing protein
MARVRTHVALGRLRSDLERRVEEQTAALQAANAQLAQHIGALNRSEEEMKARLRFEMLLSDLSAKFVNVAADEVDQVIEDAQRRVCECLDLDLSSLWQGLATPPHLLTLTHYYRRVEGPPPPEQMDARDYFPWCLQQVMAGKVFAVSSIENVPPEASRDQESWRHFGIKTSVGFPLLVGGGPPFGVLSFNDMKKEERTWSEGLVKRLELVAQIFANSLARKRAEEALRESEARLCLAADSADAGLWEMDLETGRFWATDKARNLFGIPLDSALTLDTFLTFVHPDDRERIVLTVVGPT